MLSQKIGFCILAWILRVRRCIAKDRSSNLHELSETIFCICMLSSLCGNCFYEFSLNAKRHSWILSQISEFRHKPFFSCIHDFLKTNFQWQLGTKFMLLDLEWNFFFVSSVSQYPHFVVITLTFKQIFLDRDRDFDNERDHDCDSDRDIALRVRARLISPIYFLWACIYPSSKHYSTTP